MAKIKLSDEDFQRLTQLARKTQWDYRLETFENKQLKDINKVLVKAQNDIARKLKEVKPGDKFEVARLNALADEMQDLTMAAQAQITGKIANTATTAGVESYKEHNDILSFGGRVPNFNPVALSAAQLHSIVTKTPVGGKKLNEWVESNFSKRLKDDFKAQITTGMLLGESYPNLVKRFGNGLYAGFEKDIESLTRTYVQSANVKAMDDVMAANADIVKGKKWSSTAENRTCQRCMSLDAKGTIYPIDGGPPMPLHVNCLVGETPVYAPDKRAAFVATYNGPVIEIGLTDSRRVTVTPQHMFLTPKGFITADLLIKGDEIFDSTVGKRVIPIDPNDNDSPSMIKNIVSSFSKSHGVSTESVPTSTKDFHGDAAFCDGYIDVITSDSLLGDNRDISGNEFFSKFNFDRGDHGGVGFSCFSDFLSMLFSLRDATDGGVGIRGISPVFFGRSSCHHKPIGSGIIPNFHSRIFKSLSYCSSGYIKRFCDRVFRLICKIPFLDKIIRKGNKDPIGGNPVSSNDTLDKSSVMDSDFADILHRFPGQIEIANVLFVKQRYFSGHVYDLHTFSSLYTANGLLSSNCRCFWETVTKTFKELGVNVEEIEEAYKPYTIRGTVDPVTGKLTPGKIGVGGGKIITTGRFLGSYDDFFKGLPANVQTQMLGPTRYKLWKSGKLELSGLTDVKGNTKLLTELGVAKNGEK